MAASGNCRGKVQWLHASLFCFCCFFCRAISASDANNLQKLRVGVLITIFDKNGERILTGTKRAHMALLTARDINNRNDMLPSYELEVLLRDTHRQEEFAQEEVFNLRDQSVVGLIGSSSSNPTTAIAALAKLAPVNLVLVGFRAASPTLSDQGKYPTFVRVNPTTSDGVRSIASLMQHLGWTCANYVYMSLDVFSSSAYQTFKSIAPDKNIRLASSVDLKLKPTTGEYYDAITKIMKSGCLATVIVTQSAQVAEVIYEARKRGYKGQFVILGSGMSVPDYLHRKTGNEIQVNRMMKGIFAVDYFNGAGTKRYQDMESIWWKQASTAKMNSKGTYLDCNNTVDSTGYYIYRKDGKRDGECWGMDFEKARQDYSGQGTCRTGSKLCEDSLISPSLPFLRDAIFTLASGLHEILEVKNPGNKNPGTSKVDGSHLHAVIKRNGFANGITGNITFQRGTTDRNFVQMDCVIFNFQGAKFRHVGTMAVETPDFKNCEQYKKAYGTALSKDCKTMIFHDGTANVPDVDLYGVSMDAAEHANVLFVGGLFPQFMLDGSAINELGVRQMAAVQLAFDRVNNKNDPMYGNLLPNKQLKLLVRDSKLQIDPAIEAVGQLLLGPERCVGFITAEASGPTKAMCPILKEKNVDRAMISCYATSTQLSKPSFSNLLRTPPSDDVPAMMMATLMKEQFNWTCANVLIGEGDSYSTDGAETFALVASKMNIDICTKAEFKAGSGDMKAAIKQIIDNRCCMLTVVFGQPQDLASIFVEAQAQSYSGEWVVGDNIIDSYDVVVNEMKKHLAEPAIHKFMTGMFSLGAKQFKGDEYIDFQRAWYKQPSSANMSENGKRTGYCSDAVDATGRYIWRENGVKNGRCCGFDFEQAARKRRAKDCDNDPVCLSVAITPYVAFAYDSAIALAHGLHSLLDEGLSPDNITAVRLAQAMRNSTFNGVSGRVSFQDNGDRRAEDFKYSFFEYIVYNYDGSTGNFRDVGKMKNNVFTPCKGADCSRIIFSDGSSSIPNVLRGKLKIGFLDTLFESNGKYSIPGMRRARLALELAQEINDNPKILPSYEIEVLVRDTHRQEADARNALVELKIEGVSGLIGSSSSNPTMEMATIAGLDIVDLFLMGFMAGSPALRDQAKYPTFLRVNPSISNIVRSIASLMQHFEWTCANYVYTYVDSFSVSAFHEFERIAPKKDIQLTASVKLPTDEPTPEDYDEAVTKIMKSDCLATVIVTQTTPTASIIYEARKRGYKGYFVIQGASMSIEGDIHNMANSAEEANLMLRGMHAVAPFNGVGTKRYEAMESTWWNQTSAVKMDNKGNHLVCDNATDSTGYYIYRKDGKRDGECWGMDFEKARDDYSGQGTCRTGNKLCEISLVSTYMPFLRDAIFTLASGLHEFLEVNNTGNNEVDGPDSLYEVIKRNGFADGITGNIDFESKSADRDFDKKDFIVFNFQGAKFVRVGTIVAETPDFKDCDQYKDKDGMDWSRECKKIIFHDGTEEVPYVKVVKVVEESDNSADQSTIYVLVVLLVVAGLVVIAFLVHKWKKGRAKDARKNLIRRRTLKGLNMNWSKLLNADGVGGLSLMPEDWKNAIVPKRSEAGRNLDDHLQDISMQIQIISARRFYCSSRQRQRALSALKVSLREFIEKKVAPFFASRNQMYHDALLENIDVNEHIKQQSFLSVTRANSNDSLTISFSDRKLPPIVYSEALEWPENSSNLYRQIIRLLWYLDNMFKSSYNQIFINQVTNLGLQDWDDWAINVKDLMPDGIVLTQNTSQLFELYRQASEVHSYYDSCFSRLARETNAKWHPAGLKKIFRILEKAELLRYGDFDCSKIFDIVRGTLVYDTMHGVLRGVRALFSSNYFNVVRIKDRFSNPTSACWRDVLVNGRMVFSDNTVQSHIVEIQFHQRDLRDERHKVGGHFIYERHRALFEACELVFDQHVGLKLHNLHHASQTPRRSSKMHKALAPTRNSNFTKNAEVTR